MSGEEWNDAEEALAHPLSDILRSEPFAILSENDEVRLVLRETVKAYPYVIQQCEELRAPFSDLNPKHLVALTNQYDLTEDVLGRIFLLPNERCNAILARLKKYEL